MATVKLTPKFQKVFPLGPIKGEFIVAETDGISGNDYQVNSLMTNPRILVIDAMMADASTTSSVGKASGSISDRTISFDVPDAAVKKVCMLVIGE